MAQVTLREVLMKYKVMEPALIDNLEKESGFLRTAAAFKSSHGTYHKYKEYNELPTFSVVAPGASSVGTSASSDVKQTDLKIIRAIQDEPADIVDTYPNGKAAYFDDQLPAFLEGFGQALSKAVFYGTNSTFGYSAGFKGFHQYAKAYGNVVQMAGATGSRTSIFAVKFKQGVSGLLLNSEVMNGERQFLNIDVMNGGNAVMNTTDTTKNAKQKVYQVDYSSSIGLLSASSYDVAAITQIQDDTNDKPTASGMDQILDMVKADSTNTVIYCNRTARRLLYELKNGKMEMIPGDGEYRTQIEGWNGIPLVLDENIFDTETTVLD